MSWRSGLREPTVADSSAKTIERWQAHWRAQGKTFSDSAEIIRELREERENRY